MKSMICRHVRRMTGYVPGEQMPGPGVIKLNTNETPYRPSPRVRAALRNLAADRLRLYPEPMSGRLRARIAALHKVRPEQVFVGNGSDEILRLMTLAFVEDDGALGMFMPSYSLYETLAACRNVPIRKAPLRADFGWRPPPSSFRASLFFLTSPNNPTGVAYPPAAIRRFCARFKGVVVIDEAYVDFAPRHNMALAKTLPNVLVMRSLSKSYAMAGARLGYVVGAPSLIAALDTIKDSYNVNRLTQEAALAALSDQAYKRKLVGRVKRSRSRLARELKKLGFAVTPSSANFLWVRPTRIGAKVLFEALRARKILVRYNPKDWHPGYLRITVGTDREIDALVTAIRHLQE